MVHGFLVDNLYFVGKTNITCC